MDYVSYKFINTIRVSIIQKLYQMPNPSQDYHQRRRSKRIERYMRTIQYFTLERISVVLTTHTLTHSPIIDSVVDWLTSTTQLLLRMKFPGMIPSSLTDLRLFI